MTSNARAQRLSMSLNKAGTLPAATASATASPLCFGTSSPPRPTLRAGVQFQPANRLDALAAALTAPTLLERAMAGDATAAKQFLHKAGFTDKQGQWLPQYQPIPKATNE
jgi:hypothetical protein